MPNPFDRPRAVFMLEVRGVAGTAPSSRNAYSKFLILIYIIFFKSIIKL